MRLTAVALVAVLLVATTAAALVAPAPAPVRFDAGALRASFAACGADAACLDAQADALAARWLALPTGRAGVHASVAQALAEAGVDAAPAAVEASPDLASAILALYDALGQPADAALRAEVARQAAGVPEGLALPLAALVDGVRAAHVASARILAPEDVALLAEDPALAMRLATLAGSDPTAPAEWQRLWRERAEALARVDRDALASAALALAGAAGAFDAQAVEASSCERVLALPFVEVGGPCDDVYAAPTALQVDLGGNDLYLNNAGAGLVGVLGAGLSMDLGAGADVYDAETQAQGFGLAAVGILYDEGGSDVYSITSFGQGMAFAGLGLLYDAGDGDDVYESVRAPTTIGTKAGALSGVGILVDEGGDDWYHQDGLDGFVYGAAGGHGWLLDRGEGEDVYLSQDLPITLLGQFLGEFAGPVQVSAEVGGTAVLVEEGGDDVYQCGDHVRQGCQAAGGAGALALLLDLGGDDQYRMGVSFSQELVPGVVIFPMGQGAGYGPSAPAGVALLDDEAGDDLYLAQKWAQGYGTVGVGALLDEAGADSYSVGAGDGQAWTGGTGVGVDRA